MELTTSYSSSFLTGLLPPNPGCCIYEKPRAFGESSTESDEEEEEGCGHTHCVRGHRKGRRRATLGPSPTTPPQPPDPSQPPPGPMQH